VTSITLPVNAKIHIFAVTLAVRHGSTGVDGLTVLNDSKFGCDTRGNVFRLTALRWSPGPDPNSDEGRDEFTYALLPHTGDWRDAHAEQAGLGLNVPLLSMVTSAHPAKRVPLTLSIKDSRGYGDLVAGALKRSVDGHGYILRFFETQGRDTTARLTFSRPVKVEEVDILERPLKRHKVDVEGQRVTLPVGHDQIVTLRVRMK